MSWDFIVIGGGSAGCAVASRLAERPGLRVLLLEAGGPYNSWRLSVPMASLREMTRFSWKYFTRQQEHLSHRKLSLPMGRVMGGSSAVNAMVYCRGHSRSYDAWAEAGNEGWAFREILPYFKKSENQERGVSEIHGVGGPVDVSDPRHIAPFSRAFLEACKEIGLPEVDDLNSDVTDGAGYFQVTQRRGVRVSSATAYLNSGRRRSGLTIITGALVTRLLFNGHRAVGVEYSKDGEKTAARADREIVLCAGAINSPQILMLSGVGPADALRSLGITPVLDLRGVGENLQDHVRIPVLYESQRASPGDMLYWAPSAVKYLTTGRGVMASNCCEVGAFVRSEPRELVPDLQFVTHFQSSLYPGAVDLQFCLVATKSRGRVWLASADPRKPPVIDPRYFSDTSDVRLAVTGLHLARRIARTGALERFPLGAEIMPGIDLESDRELENYVRATAETCYHPAGTCKMGRDEMSVVDSRLAVHGIEGLRVADASVMPLLPNGNTFAPTIAIGERAADLVLAARR